MISPVHKYIYKGQSNEQNNLSCIQVYFRTKETVNVVPLKLPPKT